jgi:hypothetical protein
LNNSFSTSFNDSSWNSLGCAILQRRHRVAIWTIVSWTRRFQRE